MPDSDDLKRMIKLVESCISTDEIKIIASILIKIQMEYNYLARLATDDHYDPHMWTHKDVLDYLTKGDVING